MMRAHVLLLLVASCSGEPGPDPGVSWRLLGSQRPSSLLAAWASSLDNVWIVGGREGLGGGPAVFHYDGTAWAKLDTGLVNVDLWQVFGFDDGTVFLGGSNGTILRHRAGVFETVPTPTTDIVFGLWGHSSDDVWAVGGQTTGRAFIWRYQGTQFEPLTVPSEVAMGTVWKVTGRAADDVWMSAAGGHILHHDGQLAIERIGGSGEALFSIGCDEARCVTAGSNLTNGVLYRNDGQGWSSAVPTMTGPIWRGVTPTGSHTYVVGMNGAVLRLDGETWVSDVHALTTESLHAAWSDAEGNLFVVGGQFDKALTTDGVLLYKGAATLPALP